MTKRCRPGMGGKHPCRPSARAAFVERATGVDVVNAPRARAGAAVTSYAVFTAAELLIRSAGRAQPRVLRGRSLISSATRCNSSDEMCSRSVPLGK